MTDFFSGDKPSAQEMTDATRAGIVARGRRTTSSASTTSEIGVLRLDGIALRAGRIYRIWTPPLASVSSLSGDNPGARLRYATSGAATTSSTILTTGVGYQSSFAAVAQSLVAKYVPAADQTVSLILTAVRIGGSGNVSIVTNAGNPDVEVIVEDTGRDVGDTGVVL